MRNKEFDDALDELKMLHDAKNHDYATAENPYKIWAILPFP